MILWARLVSRFPLLAHARFYDEETHKQFLECCYRKYTIGEIINAMIRTGFIFQRLDEHPSWTNPDICDSYKQMRLSID